jgi:glucose/arabinose dehydrogenase
MKNTILPGVLFLSIVACGNVVAEKKIAGTRTGFIIAAKDTLPPPFATKSVRNDSKVIAWPEGKTPVAPEGFIVTKFADSLDSPRWVYVAGNGDVFVAEAKTLRGAKKVEAQASGNAGRIILLRDANKDGVYENRYVFAEKLNQPLGMLILDNRFYVANTDALLQYSYTTGDTKLTGEGKQIVSLPASGYNNHWTRNIITNKNRDKIYISVGSGSNAAEHGLEHEIRRANILVVDPDGTDEKIYASGLRNPVGMDWAPGTETLWAAVNERDGLGDDLVPDYITSVKEGGFYGWPWSYFGQHKDPRMKDKQKPELLKKAIIPDVSVGSHTASLGLAFYDKQAFPSKYHNGAFVGQHGSWNRSTLSGYKVVFVPFAKGKPSGKPEDFLTGFIADASKSEVYGRPVCIAILEDGSMLVTDDASNTIWRVSSNK